MATNRNEVKRSRVKRSSIARHHKSSKTPTKLSSLHFLKGVFDATANFSGISPIKLAESLVPDQMINTNTEHEIVTRQEARHLTLNQRMAQIYRDIHNAALQGISAGDIDSNEIIRRGISQVDWIRSNINLQNQTMFKVIEYAAASPDFDGGSANAWRDRPVILNSALFSVELNQCTRYANLATEHGWMMLSILAHSAAFREAARTLDRESWESLQESISLNFDSLEYFAKIRYLDWHTALQRISGLWEHVSLGLKERHFDITPGNRNGYPHEFVVPEESGPLERPMFGTEIQPSNRVECLYNEFVFRGTKAPSGWPAEKRYPSDPTITDGACWICRKNDCACNPADFPKAVIKPLVELRRYGNKGVGIRTLQPIDKKKVLDEYIGKICPADYDGDPFYSFSIENNNRECIGVISARHFGNWTRFINHSCDANTHFTDKIIGRRRRVMIRTRKNIEIFEELTVDYGGEYFGSGKMFCYCGSSKCRYPPPSSE